MRLADLLTEIYLERPDALAIVQNGQMLTYRQFYDCVLQLSGYLIDNGCAPGVKVGVFFKNSPEFLIAFFAVSMSNATIVPLARDLTQYELKTKIDYTGISIIISDRDGCQEVEKTKTAVNVLSVDLKGNMDIKSVGCPNKIIIDSDNHDVALMISTSGSTSQPKHVMLTDNQLISNMQTYQNMMSFEQSQVVYCALPFCHIYSITAQILTHVSLGDTLVIPDHPFFIQEFMKTVQEHKITVSAFVSYYVSLLALFPQWADYDLSSLMYVLVGGGKTPIDCIETLREKFPSVKFMSTYGMTEAGSRISVAGPKPLDYPIGSVGKPMSGVDVKIIDDSNNQLQPGEMGQIIIKSSGVMKGYYKQPELTKEVLSDDGWLKTGDIGTVDIAGNIYVEGRKKNIIISGGRNIYPHEIEECLLKHPLILEAVVVSKPQPKLQEVPYAFLVTVDNGNIAYRDFVIHCRKYLSSYKIPQGYKIVEEFPKLGISKVNRQGLAAMLTEEQLS